jgi:Conserved hypothetical protein 2217 (DUF2460)
MTAIFPSLPGMGWSVVKSPRFATRIQRAVNGRELRALDQPYPLWNWTLTYPLLRDRNDMRAPLPAAGGFGIGYDELRILAGFFLQQQGALQPFLLTIRPTTSRPPSRSAPATAAARFFSSSAIWAVSPSRSPRPIPCRRSISTGSCNPPRITRSMPRPVLLLLQRRRPRASLSPPISPISSASGLPTTPPNSRISCSSSGRLARSSSNPSCCERALAPPLQSGEGDHAKHGGGGARSI